MSLLKTLGKNPSGAVLEKVKQSPNYKNNAFKNSSPTVMMAGNDSFIKILWKFINKPPGTKPAGLIPSVKTDLKTLNAEKPVIVWFGHSSYFIRIGGTNILVDPVFSGHASPFSFTAKSFPGANVYGVDDIPPVDILIITHDHYDHLDYETVLKLRSKTTLVCTSLGVASHLVYWGFDKNNIIEFDWWDSKNISPGIKISTTTARHFSGRSFVRNKTLWSAFILDAYGYKIYIGGDSGYDNHFKRIGDTFGSFDLAILESGQYNTAWPQIHMMPEETVQASVDLKAKVLLPVHWGKFSLSMHAWDEPVRRVMAKAGELGVRVTTPMIGEQVIIDECYPDSKWWEGVGK